MHGPSGESPGTFRISSCLEPMGTHHLIEPDDILHGLADRVVDNSSAFIGYAACPTS